MTPLTKLNHSDATYTLCALLPDTFVQRLYAFTKSIQPFVDIKNALPQPIPYIRLLENVATQHIETIKARLPKQPCKIQLRETVIIEQLGQTCLAKSIDSPELIQFCQQWANPYQIVRYATKRPLLIVGRIMPEQREYYYQQLEHFLLPKRTMIHGFGLLDDQGLLHRLKIYVIDTQADIDWIHQQKTVGRDSLDIGMQIMGQGYDYLKQAMADLKTYDDMLVEACKRTLSRSKNK